MFTATCDINVQKRNHYVKMSALCGFRTLPTTKSIKTWSNLGTVFMVQNLEYNFSQLPLKRYENAMLESQVLYLTGRVDLSPKIYLLIRGWD